MHHVLLGALVLLACPSCVRAGFDRAPQGTDGQAASEQRTGDAAGASEQRAGDAAGAGERGRDQPTRLESGPAGDLGPRQDLGGLAVTAANDTCATPLTVDLAPVAGGASLDLLVQSAGDKKDSPACTAGVDVMVRFLHSAGSYQATCSGGGAILLRFETAQPSQCPTQVALGVSTVVCNGSKDTLSLAVGEVLMVLCTSGSTSQALRLEK